MLLLIKSSNPGSRSYPDPPPGSRWITVHPNGPSAEGHPVLVVPSPTRSGTWHVVGGAGNKLNHMEIHLGAPETWKKNTADNRKLRDEKRRQSGVNIDEETKQSVRDAQTETKRQFVKRVADAMGWSDYQDKDASDFLKEAQGDEGVARTLAHQYFSSYVSKAQEAARTLQRQIRSEHFADHGIDFGVTKDTDPYQATPEDLHAGDLAQKLQQAREKGQDDLADHYQAAMDAARSGDEDLAIGLLTEANRAAGDRHLAMENITGAQASSAATAKYTARAQAIDRLNRDGKLTQEHIKERIAQLHGVAGSDRDNHTQYLGALEQTMLDKARQEISKGDETKAGGYYLQAEKYARLAEKFDADNEAFESWRDAREKMVKRAATVRAVKNQGGFGAANVDTDVKDLGLARKLLVAKAVFDDRMRELRGAARTFDKEKIGSTVGQQVASEHDVNWDAFSKKVEDEAYKAISHSGDAKVAADLINSVEDTDTFLTGLGSGAPVDQQKMQRYIEYGRSSAFRLLGQVGQGSEYLPDTALQALGVKASAKLIAQHMANTSPDEFEKVKASIEKYHVGRQFDVANGALVSAHACLASAQEYKDAADHNVDRLSQAAKYNALRMDAVEQAIATLGEAYGELNALGELNYAFASVKPGAATNVTIQMKSSADAIATATALGLERKDYDLSKQDKETKQPRGITIHPSGMEKMLAKETPVQAKRTAKLMSIRAGDEDEDGWLPDGFAKRPGVSKEFNKAAEDTINGNPLASVAFKKMGDLRPADIKALQGYFSKNIGKKQPAGVKRGKLAVSPAIESDVFGNPFELAKMTGKDQAWDSFVQRMGGSQEKALELVQDVVRGQVTDSFVRNHKNNGGQPLQTTTTQLRSGQGERTALQPQDEANLAALAEGKMLGMSMSGKFINQQRTIKQLFASGGLHGQEGGRIYAALGTGSGKTKTAIGAAMHALMNNKAKKVIFAVPSAVQGQFGPEMDSVIDPTSGVKHTGTSSLDTKDRHAALSGDHQIYVTTHQALREDAAHALAEHLGVGHRAVGRKFNSMSREKRAKTLRAAFERKGWGDRLDFLAVDEAHEFANREGKDNSLMANVADAISDNAKYFMPMSATSIKNDASEGYDALSKVRPDEYPDSGRKAFLARHGLITSQVARHKQFRDNDRNAGGGDKKDWTGSAAAESFQHEMASVFYSTNVPIDAKLSEHTHNVKLSPEQRKAYDRVDELEAKVNRHKRSKQPITQDVVNALRELSPNSFKHGPGNKHDMPQGTDDAPVHQERAKAEALLKAMGMVRDAAYNRVLHEMPDNNAKIQKLSEIVEDKMNQTEADDPSHTGKPGIIFARNINSVSSIRKALAAKGYTERVDEISGKDSGQRKLQKKLRFQPPAGKKATCDILVLSDAMSAGIDLPRGEWVIHYDTPDTAKTKNQRTGRIRRLTTKHAVESHTLVSDTPYEQRRVRRVDSKSGLLDVSGNPAEVLDDSGYARHYNADRYTKLRQGVSQGKASNAHPDNP